MKFKRLLQYYKTYLLFAVNITTISILISYIIVSLNALNNYVTLTYTGDPKVFWTFLKYIDKQMVTDNY